MGLRFDLFFWIIAFFASIDAVIGPKAGIVENSIPLSLIEDFAEKGNEPAIDFLFRIRAFHLVSEIATNEEIGRSIGIASTLKPAFFLTKLLEFDQSDQRIAYLVVQHSRESIDNVDSYCSELQARDKSFHRVDDEQLSIIKNKAIGFLEKEIQKYCSNKQ